MINQVTKYDSDMHKLYFFIIEQIFDTDIFAIFFQSLTSKFQDKV